MVTIMIYATTSDETDLYYAGASVHPPGDHAGASILSGAIVSNLLVNRATNLRRMVKNE